MHHPGDDVCSAPHADQFYYWLHPDAPGFGGRLFLDGSCFPSRFKELSRAGWAVVACDALGNVVGIARGIVPPFMPQTSQAGEARSLLQAASLSNVSSDLFVDYKGLIGAWEDPWDRVSLSAHAATFRQARGQEGWKHMDSITHVKAHQTIDDEMSEEIRLQVLGNTRADEEAKAGAKMHPPFNEKLVADAESRADLCRRVALFAGRALAAWDSGPSRPTPRTKHARRPRPLTGASVPRLRLMDGHVWRWHGSFFRCEVCLRHRFASSFSTARQRKCEGVSPGLAKVLSGSRQGHNLVCHSLEDGCSVIACLLCGAWMQTKAKDLLQACPVGKLGLTKASLSRGARDAMSRVGKGQHPRTGNGPSKVLGPGLPIPLIGPAMLHDDPA